MLWRTCALLVVVVLALPAQDVYVYERTYGEGAGELYEIRLQPGGADRALTGVLEHKATLRGGVPVETVYWVRLSETELGDVSDLLPALREPQPLSRWLSAGGGGERSIIGELAAAYASRPV